jgi:hypothetical protein
MRQSSRTLLAVVAALVAPLGCTGDVLLGPDAAQGIDGLVLLGPICPVQTEANPCPDQPYAATIVVEDEGGGRITTLHSGEDGRFRVGLAPGRYRLVPESGNPLPSAGEQDVEVPAGTWVDLTVGYDTGIR